MRWLLMFAGAFVGGIVGLILIITVVWFLFKWWLKRKLSGVVEQFHSLAMLADTVPPFRIELQPGVSEAWNEDLAQPLYEPLLERGFVDAGAFRNESSPISSFSVKGFASPELGVWAAVFHHEQAGYWLELVTQYADETNQAADPDRRVRHHVAVERTNAASHRTFRRVILSSGGHDGLVGNHPAEWKMTNEK